MALTNYDDNTDNDVVLIKLIAEYGLLENSKHLFTCVVENRDMFVKNKVCITQTTMVSILDPGPLECTGRRQR